MTFTIDGTAGAPVALVAGQAIYSTSTLTVGTHSIVASYGGDTATLPSTSATLTQIVGPALRATNTTVTSNRNPSTFGQSVTFIATVRPVSGTGIPTGTVQINIDGINVGAAVTLNAQGRATYATTTLSAGSHNVIAVYSGSSIFAGSTSSTLIQVVNRQATTTTVTSSRNPSVYGQSVTFTARVRQASGTIIPTGTVQFSIDGNSFGGPVALDATGRATITPNTLSVGSHTVSAVYSGDTNYLGSTSANLTQTVKKANSRTVVTTSGSPALSGTTVIFTATVTSSVAGAGIPTGTVRFFIDGITSGVPVTLNGSGIATYAISTLSIGRHTITAVYSGDSSFNTSTSGGITQRIR